MRITAAETLHITTSTVCIGMFVFWPDHSRTFMPKRDVKNESGRKNTVKTVKVITALLCCAARSAALRARARFHDICLLLLHVQKSFEVILCHSTIVKHMVDQVVILRQLVKCFLKPVSSVSGEVVLGDYFAKFTYHFLLLV